MKSVVLITAYCETDAKRDILNDCINHFKDLNFDVCVSSHYPLSLDTQSLSDYCIYDKSNPVIYDGTKSITRWRWYCTADRMLNFNTPDYSYAVINLWKNGLVYLKNLGYDKIMVVNYDAKMDKIFIDNCLDFLDTYDIGFFTMPIKDVSYNIDQILITIFIVKSTIIDYFLNEVSYDNYISCSNAMLEQFLGIQVIPRLKEKYNVIEITENYYKDKIQAGIVTITDQFDSLDRYYYNENGKNLWYSLFVGQNINTGFVEIMVYEIFNKIDNIKIKVDDKIYTSLSIDSKYYILDTQISNNLFKSISDIEIYVNDECVFNKIDLYKCQKMNTIIYFRKYEG